MRRHSLICILLLIPSMLFADQIRDSENLSEILTKKLKNTFTPDEHTELFTDNALSTPLRLNENQFPFHHRFKKDKPILSAKTACAFWFSDIEVERTSFKIIEISSQSSDTATTRVLAGLYGTSKDGNRLERHGEWNIKWVISDELKSIKQLSAIKYESTLGGGTNSIDRKDQSNFHQRISRSMDSIKNLWTAVDKLPEQRNDQPTKLLPRCRCS